MLVFVTLSFHYFFISVDYYIYYWFIIKLLITQYRVCFCYLTKTDITGCYFFIGEILHYPFQV